MTPSTVTVSPIDPTASDMSSRERAPSSRAHRLLEALEPGGLDLHQVFARREVENEVDTRRSRRHGRGNTGGQARDLTWAFAITASDGSRTMPVSVARSTCA